MPIEIAGGIFTLPDTPQKTVKRGRKSPTGGSTQKPFNEFVWHLLTENTQNGLMKHEALHDGQLLEVLKQEFATEAKVMTHICKRQQYYLAQLRSYYNRNVLVTGWTCVYPSLPMNTTGRIVISDTGRVIVEKEIIKKLTACGMSPQQQQKYLEMYRT